MGLASSIRTNLKPLADRVRAGYGRLRHRLPTTGYVRYNGVAINRPVKWGERSILRRLAPQGLVDIPLYESALASGLRASVREGDHVVIVGGGLGVTAAIAAERVGSSGRVDVYEASQQAVAESLWTLHHAGFAERVHVHHAAVGRTVEVWGSLGSAARLSASDLPACDVLELDCESAELDILENLPFRPRTILVETHGSFGAPTKTVQGMLEDLGYTVGVPLVAEVNVHDFCVANDIMVLTAHLPEPEPAA